MKKLLLLLLVCLSCGYSHAQSCTAPLFTSQQQIDDFKTQNPGCKTLTGSVQIEGSGITNLNGLSNITEVQNDLVIRNTSLTTLNGLGALTSVGGRLTINNNALLVGVTGVEKLTTLNDGVNIEQNPSLKDLDGFQALSYVGSYLRVVYNASLTSIQALHQITEVTYFLSVGANPLLESLSGLHNITKADNVSIALNTSLTSLDGLRSLSHTTGYLYVGFNAKIKNLQGLNKLKTVEGYLGVNNNAQLISLDGLDAMESVWVIEIYENVSLTNCAIITVCRAVRHSPAYIYGNASGCSTIEELDGQCSIFPVELVSFAGENTAEGNVLKWVTASEVNNKGFEVEKSLNGRSFQTIGFVEGNTDSNRPLNYSFTDRAAHSLTYYRLKQIDWDGTSSYSKIIALKGKKESLTVYPNPSSGRLFVTAENLNQPYLIRNSKGITVQKSANVPPDGIDIHALKDGLYFITVGKEVVKVLVDNE